MVITRKFGLSASSHIPLIGSLLLSALTSADEALATSEETIRIEEFVSAEASSATTLTQMLIYEEGSWLASLQTSESSPVRVNAHFALEDGASAVYFTPNAELDLDVGYAPIDLDLRFDRTGVFAGKMQLEFLVAGRSIIHNKHFWMSRDELGTALISHREYTARRRAQIQPIASDPTANLEPDDVPGESTFAPEFSNCKGGGLCR